MEFGVIGEFRAKPGKEGAVEAAIRKVIPVTASERACISISGWRSNRDSALFYIHSRWNDEAAFEAHAALPHTVEFITRVVPLITASRLEVVRLTRIA